MALFEDRRKYVLQHLDVFNSGQFFTDKEMIVFELYYGLNGQINHSLASIGKRYKIKPTSVKQIVLIATRKFERLIRIKKKFEEMGAVAPFLK